MTSMLTPRRFVIAALVVGGAAIFGAAAVAESADMKMRDIAMTSAKPPVDHAGLLGRTVADAVDQSRIEQRPQDTDVVVSGTAQSARIVVVDEDGDTIYEADPGAATTAIARDAAIPTVTVLQAPSELIQLRIITGTAPTSGAVAEVPPGAPAVPPAPTAPEAD